MDECIFCMCMVQLRLHMEETCYILFTKWIWSNISFCFLVISTFTTSLIRTPSRFHIIYKCDTFFSMEQKCLQFLLCLLFCAPIRLSSAPYNNVRILYFDIFYLTYLLLTNLSLSTISFVSTKLSFSIICNFFAQ